MTPAAQIDQPSFTLALSRQVEQASINAWPAMQQLLLDGWLLRFARGFTKRANSVIPLYPGEQALADKVRYCENTYARERLQCIFRLTSMGAGVGPGQSGAVSAVAAGAVNGHGDQGLDEFLALRGYSQLEPTEVMTVALQQPERPPERPPQRPPLSPRMSLLTVDRWLEAYTRLTGMPESARALHGAILRGIPLPCAYAVIGPPEAPLACGLAVLEQDLVGLFDIVTNIQARRAGHGTAMVNSLLAWAVDNGASRGYLQMVADNEPARGLYARLGFSTLYRYWYRVSP